MMGLNDTMSKPLVVNAAYVECMNISWNLNIFSGPKMTITCGNVDCGHTFKDRPPLINYPTSICPACRAVNKIQMTYVGIDE
jgi:hypothetical protein